MGNLSRGDVVVDRNGRIYLVCCSGDCGVPMVAYSYEEKENGDVGMGFKYIREDWLTKIGVL